MVSSVRLPGGLLAAELDLALGKDLAVGGVDLVDDELGGLFDDVVGALVLLKVHTLDADAVLGDDNSADGGELGTGGGQQGVADLAVLADKGLDIVKAAVAVSVDEHVDARLTASSRSTER